MNKLIIIAALVAVVTCEPPSGYGVPSQPIGSNDFSQSSGGFSKGSSSYVDDALLARIAQIISNGGDGSSSGPQTNEGRQYVDAAIFTRVADSLNEGGSSSGPSDSYGAPTKSGRATLGQPEPAERIADFALEDNSGSSSGGYPSAKTPAQQQPSGGYPKGPSGSTGQISLGRPEVARRVADFAAASTSGSTGGYQPPQTPQRRGGY